MAPNQPHSTAEPRLVTHRRLAIIIAAIVVCGPLLAASAPAALAAAPEPADEALDAKERAQSRLAELETLDATAEVTIEQSALRSIRNRIKQGNLSYERANYEQAKKHYQIAQEQARAALKQGYTRRASILLNASVSQLQDLKEHGYTAAGTATLSERGTRLRDRLENADTLTDARSVHNDIESLHGDVGELPPVSTVKLADRMSGNLLLIGVGLAMTHLLGVAIAIRLDRARGPDRTTDDDDEDDERDTTPSKLNNQSYQ